jgi:RimJ/RimL family protein N-acetyltransferase
MTATRPCPVLRTARLTLRAHTLADHADSLALWSDPDVARHIGGVASTAEEVWTRVLRYGGLWPLLGYGYWHVSETQAGRFLGEAGLADYRRTLAGVSGFAPEAGWAFLPAAHGRGYAREAMEAILGWADEVLRPVRTVCMIAPANASSIRLAERLGYAPMGSAVYRGSETLLFERHGPALDRARPATPLREENRR